MGKSSSNSMKEWCIEISENSVGLEVEYDSLKKAYDEELPIVYV